MIPEISELSGDIAEFNSGADEREELDVSEKSKKMV